MSGYAQRRFNHRLRGDDITKRARRSDLVGWTAAALKITVQAHPLLIAESKKANGPFTRAALAEFISSLVDHTVGNAS